MNILKQMPVWIYISLFGLISYIKSTTVMEIGIINQQDTTASGLIYEIIETGSGPIAKVGDVVLIHETTQLVDGTMITDTWALNHPIRFLLGGNQVIKGMDEAVTGMQVGERRKLIVPPSLSKRSSYPENGLYGPSDTLYYNVILLQVSEYKK
ncbi:FKBP-type peptidyl-prolyl cis-trans isomerase [Fulvivirgaceae bacterium BMA10]|uniref:Peptidyl-prolyl cis-trans isomerase n=1 Tax=Splendidivirga corallicola TaxID=3051826 RepID=A0ABT8KP03_9BACT|nr:FKBP-type peptidyl-prolyl cis-trans isomerase [Fulvivirgaceae bacterium BMA10]